MRAPARSTTAYESGKAGAHDRFKQQSRNSMWVGLIIATAIHFALLAFMPVAQPEPPQPVERVPRMSAYRLLDNIEVPPPPERIAPLAPPILPPGAPIDDIDVQPINLPEEFGQPPPIPAPPVSSASDELPGFEHFVPSMVRPVLVNRDQVRRRLEREYPRHLQAAGIGGALLILFWIDEDGEVWKHEIKKSSGRDALDRAAERVIPIMKFRPAFKMGRPVNIIVALPVRFESY